MDQAGQDPIDELKEFLESLEAFAPTRADRSTGVEYRSVSEEEVVEDSLPSEQSSDEEDYDQAEDQVESGESEPDEFEHSGISEFREYDSGPVAAVDCGIVRLGETENGIVIALRAAIIVDRDEKSQISLFRSGPIYLHNHHRAQLLHLMGKQLGRPDFFVDLDESNSENPNPIRVKSGVADNSHQYGDRFRNWFERVVQLIAVSSVGNGAVLFDGALTLRTRDTPAAYLQRLARLAGEKGNAIIAISKQSMLQIQDRPIRFWLNDHPNVACYRSLTHLMRREGAERVLGNAYAARFSILGPTFRMDVRSAPGQTDHEAVSQLYSSALMRGGYPDIMVRAHTHSYFTSPDVIQLQAQAGAKYRLVPQGEVDLSGIFGPFGGRFK